MTRMHKQFLILLLAGVSGPVMAQAVAPEIAAEQVMHDFNTNGFVLGQNGNANFKFAQSFHLPRTGAVSHLMLPIYCSTATSVRVTLQVLREGLPSGVALVTQDVPASALNSWVAANGMMSMRMVQFDRPRIMRPGDYAFTIEAVGGECLLWPGPAGDSYAAGQAFVINGVSLPTWYPWNRDLAFQVFALPR